ncbi:MAG: energy transducer TonB [Gammaproteobacteria bacterium]|nr:energy transducer TonB [Gammaproteobacteria bacterium]
MSARLPRFVLLSLFAHAALIAALRVPGSVPVAGQTLDITLLPPAIRSYSAGSPHRSGRSAYRKRAAPAAPAPRRPRVVATRSAVGPDGIVAPRPPARRAAASQPEQRPGAQGARSRNSVQAPMAGHRLVHAILTASVPYFHYPLLAREEGWEGRVIIRLRVGAGGHLSHARIASSSGYAVLDAAALHSLRQVARLPAGIVSRNAAAFDVLVPIVYRLTDS